MNLPSAARLGAAVVIIGLLSGCHRPLDQGSPEQLKAAAETVLLPHLTEERREEVLKTIKGSALPESIILPATSGNSEEERRAARIVLAQVGTGADDIERRRSNLARLIRGITARSMSDAELEALGPMIDAKMHWAVVDGNLLLGRDDAEVAQLTSGINLATSPGLTRYGAGMVREMTEGVLEAWRGGGAVEFSAEVRYIAALFGARESLEAAVVIFSVLTAIGLAGTGLLVGRKILAGIGAALCLAVVTGFIWHLLIHAGSIVGWKQGIFVSFGILSIVMFLVIGSAIFHPIYFGKWMGVLRGLARKRAGQAAFWVAFLAVYREGFEMSLSMTTLSMMGGWQAVFQGLGLGVPAGILMIALGWKIHRGWIGVRGMLIASGAMMVLAAASFSALFVNYLEQQGAVIPTYIIQDVPISVTVFTGFSGSLQTLAAFLTVAGGLLVPWILRRGRSYLSRRKTIERGLALDAVRAFAVAGVVGAVCAVAGSNRAGNIEEVPWETVLAEVRAGRGVIADARELGVLPIIEDAVALPPDNDDDSLREFCNFAREFGVVFVYQPGGTEMAARLSDACELRVKVIKQGVVP